MLRLSEGPSDSSRASLSKDRTIAWDLTFEKAFIRKYSDCSNPNASDRAMIAARARLQPLQQVYHYERKTMWSRGMSCRLCSIRYLSCFKTAKLVMESNGDAVVRSAPSSTSPAVTCKLSTPEWSGTKAANSRCTTSHVRGTRNAISTQSRVGTAAGIDEERSSYDELGRYGIDESDYNPLNLSSLVSSPQSRHISEELKTIPSTKVNTNFSSEKKLRNATVEDPENEEESEDEGHDWCAYIILSNDRRKTYLGVASNVKRRLRQHNGELAGGAKTARGGRPWTLVCTIWGFSTRSEACQFEWRLRNFSKGYIEIDGTFSEEVPTQFHGSHVVLRRWIAFKKVHGTLDEWKHLRVEWH